MAFGLVKCCKATRQNEVAGKPLDNTKLERNMNPEL